MVIYVLLLVCVPTILLLSLSPVSEFLAALRKRPTLEPRTPVTPSDLLFLIPAHNEELLISDCVRSLFLMEYPATSRKVVVVADNCTDRTAELARAGGAYCLERRDPDRPGKPHALAWALDRLPVEKWDACVIIDADTTVDPQFAWRLTAHAPLRSRCVQAYFDLSNQEETWLTRLASVLARIRYERLYPLKRSSGLNSPLTGNGMCIGSDLLSRSGWTAFSLTENWELYARYTADGITIEYEPGARLYSHEASSLAQATTQRKRWLAGRTWTLFHCMLPLLRSRRIGFHQKLDALAELASPSPVLHLMLVLAVVLLSLSTFSRPLGVAVAAAASITLLPFTIHTAAVLSTHPQRWRTLASLAFLPVYALWRIITAVGTVTTLIRGRWTKTERI